MSRAYKSLIAAALFAAAAPLADAQTDVRVATEKVAYGDLNLGTVSGAETLLRRIDSATAKVCGKRPSPRQIGATARHQICVQHAMSRAVAAVNAPMVTALFSGRTGSETAAR